MPLYYLFLDPRKYAPTATMASTKKRSSHVVVSRPPEGTGVGVGVGVAGTGVTGTVVGVAVGSAVGVGVGVAIGVGVAGLP